MLAIVLLLVVCSCTDAVVQLTVTVDNGSHFVNTLCKEHTAENLIIILNHSLSYEIDANKSCLVNITASVTIQSDTNDTVKVSCVRKKFLIAFGFMDMNVTISNVVFVACGAPLSSFKRNFIDRINSSSLLFTKYHAGFLIFINCCVDFYKVSVAYPGFTIIGINLRHSQFTNVSISNSINGVKGSGSGMLIMYNTAATKSLVSHPHIMLSNCNFSNNVAYYPGSNHICISSLYLNIAKPSHLVNAGGLTIVFDKLNISYPLILISKTTFYGNIGTYGGGIMILMLDTSKGCVEIVDSFFIRNNVIHRCGGGALELYANSNSTTDVVPLKITETVFSFHWHTHLSVLETNAHGTVAISVYNFKSKFIVHFKRVSFNGNTGIKYGSCLTVTSSSSTGVSVILESITAVDNYQTLIRIYPLPDNGLFTLENVHSVIINGSISHPSTFARNYGSVVKTDHSNVILGGHVKFHDNYAINGAALNMIDSILFLENDVSLTILRNTAVRLGGAFYIINRFFSGLPKCAVQFNPLYSHAGQFISNTADLCGNSIFAYPIYNCYIHDNFKIISNTSYYYQHLLGSREGKSPGNDSEISTRAFSLQRCVHKHNEHMLNFYAGQTLHIAIAAYDEANNSGYTEVDVSLHGIHESNFSFDVIVIERQQIVHEIVGNTCSILNITISLPIGYPDKGCYLYLTPIESAIFSLFQLFLDECPPGFILKDGICKCSKAVVNFFNDNSYGTAECNINDLTISKPTRSSPWIGIIPDSNDFVMTKSCPLAFCKPIAHFSSFMFNRTTGKYDVTMLTAVSELCREHRVGIMCSSCEPNYSVVFGSDECKKCSNIWLSSVTVFIFGGPLLLYFIYVFDLTLASGTLNGIIFFGQVSNAGLIQSMVLFPDNQQRFGLIGFLSILNLKLPLSACFFDGMNELWRAGLNLAFPIYLLSIVGVVIILSKYSFWFAKKFSRSSTQILVTVVHLSIVQILCTTFDVVKSVTLYIDNGTITAWSRNCSIEYMSNGHAIVFCITIFTAIIVFVPYITILLFGKLCIKQSLVCNLYARPYLEAIHAPYKENRDYWFVLRLLFVIVLYSLYNVKPSMFLFVIAAFLSILLFAQMFLQPMRNKLLNIVDFLIVFNCTISYFIIFFFYSNEKESINNVTMNVIFFTSLYLVMAVFICIIFYHITKTLGILKKLMSIFTRMAVFFKNSFVCRSVMLSRFHSDRCQNDTSGSFYDSCNDYREPLIDHSRESY